MKRNNIYHPMMKNLEGAINNLENQVYTDMLSANLHDALILRDIREHIKDLTYHKCQCIQMLREVGLLVYDDMPF